jgi:hypothetical protein
MNQPHKLIGLIGQKRSISTSVKNPAKRHKKTIVFVIDKRQKFVISVGLLSIILFLAEHLGLQQHDTAVFISVSVAVLTNILLYWALRSDLKGNFTAIIFILPFIYSLAFGLFYFVIPAQFFARVILTGLYAFGLYSLFLSQNIFTVASIRTIALLSGARIVSFVITLISFFFLTNVIFTLHLSIIPTALLLFICTYLLITHSIWTYALQKVNYSLPLWNLGLTLCLVEAGTVLWFWPSSPTVLALFLTGFYYTLVGLSHVWLEKRLFRSVLWEYIWVGVIVFIVLQLFSSWGN